MKTHFKILKNIKSTSIFLILLTAYINTSAQGHKSATTKIINIPFEASRFDTTGRKTDFLIYKGIKSMKISESPTRQSVPVTLKDLNFIDGTIEFDAVPAEGSYDDEIAVNFHQRDIYNFESLYLRIQPDETRQRDDAIQYTPFIHGVNLWDLMKPFRGFANIRNKEWNHIKLVISGLQMLVYINSKDHPALKISRLEGKYSTGSISFDGNAIFANLVVKPNQTESLSPNEGPDWTDNDPTYLRKWEVSNPKTIAKGKELTTDDLPSDTTAWQPIVAERRGLINLNRKFEGPEFTSYPKYRRYVWLKTNIRSAKSLRSRLQLGFNKEVYVFLNKDLVYLDKNEAGEYYQKYPGGLLDIANTSFNLPLKEGDNELLIGIAVQVYGWGIVGRMESLRDITIQQ